ncbi:hypothetical protein C7S15_3248 [Burkholderia cepacia]|nr:hypothetical protein [Burkholderia cepacia]
MSLNFSIPETAVSIRIFAAEHITDLLELANHVRVQRG